MIGHLSRQPLNEVVQDVLVDKRWYLSNRSNGVT